ncbi:MAG: glycosyltransferase family 39 protein [Deltaproteobacteria bacterium]|nr:glycosyltransferase family 39 protein [Deltaproteobacteria bacterium]
MGLHPMPAYPFLIAIVHFIIPNWVAAAKVISISTSILVLIPLYLLAKDLFDRKAAFWGCLAFAFAPFPNGCAVEVIRGPSFLFFLAWAVYFAGRAIESTRLIFFLTTALFAWASAFFRIEGIIFIPLYLFFLIGITLWKQGEKGPFLKGMLVWIAFPMVAIAVLFAVPEAASSNLVSQLTQKLNDLIHIRFLDTYHSIYDQLKALENASPYPSGNQNLAEIARHFMPVIYFLGLIETFIKVLFPLFVIPLFWSFRHSFSRTRLLVLILTVAYLLMVYYTLLEKDFIQSRFLFAPAFLLYPWIGMGLERIFAFLMRSSRPGFLTTFFVIIFFISPVYESVHHVWKQDNIIAASGEWLANRAGFQKATIITNDPRIPFYAGRGNDFLNYPNLNHDYTAMQQAALKNRMDLLVIRTSVKKKKLIPQLQVYKKFKEFAGKKDVVIIYRSPEFREPPSVESR